MTRVLATAMPTAKAPTIGERPTTAAMPAAAKNEAVVIPSTLPLDYHSLSTCNTLGIKKMVTIRRAAKMPSMYRIRSVMSIRFDARFPVCTIVVTTDSTATQVCHQQSQLLVSDALQAYGFFQARSKPELI
jgi:hypothetical protein